jgi:hypothetical protein
MKENKGQNREIEAIGSCKTGALLLARYSPGTMFFRLRAESPVINSTGRCPVVFGRKCSPCAVRHNMLVENTGRRPSLRPVEDGMWVEKRKRYNISANTFRPGRDGWRNCTGYFVFYQHIVPTAQRLHFLPNTTGRCPVLLIAELSALRPKAMAGDYAGRTKLEAIYAENTTN